MIRGAGGKRQEVPHAVARSLDGRGRRRSAAGDVLAKIPRETTKTKDITGGLPRVVELFETRKPKDPAVISEIDGIVKYGEIAKGQRKIYVESEDGKTHEGILDSSRRPHQRAGRRTRARPASL